jgi:integrase
VRIYPKRGVYYAPPSTTYTRKALSLRTKDRSEAERRFIALQYAEVSGGDVGALVNSWSPAAPPEPLAGGIAQLVEQPTFNRLAAGSTPAAPTPKRTAPPAPRAGVRFSAAVAAYLTHKRRNIAPATVAAYEGHVRQILAQLGDPMLDEIEAAVTAWAESEVERLGRSHTVVKRLESIIKPAVRLAIKRGMLGREPIWPELRNDYHGEGARKNAFTRAEFAATRTELPEMAMLENVGGRPAVPCFPRLWADLAVATGMHDSDLNRFALNETTWDRDEHRWFRRNEKAARHYRPEWLPTSPYLQEVFERARNLGRVGNRPLVANEPPAKQWMRRRLIWAARRAGLQWEPAPIDFRRTFATWAREEGWEFDEVAKWLGNSSGIVREVYAQIPEARMRRAVARSRGASRGLLKLANELEGERRPPVRAFGSGEVVDEGSETGSVSGKIRLSYEEVTSGKVSRMLGGPQD